ncbi:hypothetical protein TWF481_009209 [Arthrobotrys musiformis]|uniref:Uncharacterized protein n=1 Tax=Arthrobotrys musiformis TaxID=47236 RepID=A0AAV9W2X1_9PEZI
MSDDEWFQEELYDSIEDDADQYQFDITLGRDGGDFRFHTRNDGQQIQRANIIDDVCRGLHIQAQIDRIIHGMSTESGDPATLIVFGFRFNGFDDDRRFRSANINILFQDFEKRRPHEGNFYDPEVIALWPEDTLQFSQTAVAVQNVKAVEVGADAGAMGFSAGVGFTREKQTNFQRTDKSTIRGAICLDMETRNFGPDNSIQLWLRENKAEQSGVANHVRAVVLLKRKNMIDHFTASVKVDVSADVLYNTKRTMRKLLGGTGGNDPVVFKPGVQYLRPSIELDPEAGYLAAEIDKDNLGAQMHKLKTDLRMAIKSW